MRGPRVNNLLRGSRQFHGVPSLFAFVLFLLVVLISKTRTSGEHFITRRDDVSELPCPRAISAFNAADPLGEPSRLHDLANRHRATYARALPYTHIIFDDFVPKLYLKKVLEEINGSFENPEAKWKTHVKTTSIKSNTYIREDEFHVIGQYTERLFEYLNSETFLRFLEQLTDIPDIIRDPAMNGAGVSKIDGGGYLNIHADFNQEPAQKTPGWRRLNLLLYLNLDWRETNGGSLELWKTSMAHDTFQYIGKVLPTFNRAVIFSTTELSMHGHMDLVEHGKSRLTVSTYYYTKDRGVDISPEIHSTIYPGQFLGTQSHNRWNDLKPFCPLVA